MCRHRAKSADFQECVDYGLLALADGVYDKAYEYFHKASLKDPTNIMASGFS